MTERERKRVSICKNRKARHDYHIEDTYDAGIVLSGSEVKSLREGRAELRDAYAHVRRGELWLVGARISQYEKANRQNHEPDQERKLLLRRGEIDKLEGKLKTPGLTLVPLELYFDGSWAKVQLALARGKKTYDKRHAIAEREADRALRGAMKKRQQRME
jgi:SsrA-binding protein